MSGYKDLDEVLDGRYPLMIGGNVYFVPEPTVREGLRIQKLFNTADASLSDAQEQDEILKLLGPVWKEMSSAGVGRTKALFAGRIALLHYGLGDGVARAYASGGLDDPKNPLPRRRKTFRFRGRTAKTIPAVDHGSKQAEHAPGTTQVPRRKKR